MKEFNPIKQLVLTLTIFLLIMPQTSTTARNKPVRILLELHTSSLEFKEDLVRDYPNVRVIDRFETLIDGIAIEGKRNQLTRILEHDAVKQVYPIMTYSATPENMQLIEASTMPKPPAQSDQRYTGKGVKVGVIDTGIDYTHPDLEKNYKGGYDVVDFDDDPMETMPEQGPATMHGTHVAGIIGANGIHKGVAPDAEIYGYRALGPGGTGTSIQVIAALERAVDDGMDIINLSLGNNVNGPDYPTSIAVNKAIEQGVTIVIANGNSGPADWTVGSPATATNAISVGATTNSHQIPTLTEPTTNKSIELDKITNTAPWNLTRDYPLFSAGLATEPMPDATGKIVLIKRGEITFSEKMAQAEMANAQAVLIYNDTDESIGVGIEFQSATPAAFIAREDGEWLLEQLQNQPNVWLSTSFQTVDKQIASFSSRGPVTANWEIKPEVVAPGVDIISTIPDGYAKMQGTSMAAPFVAGVLAVLKEAHPDWGPAQLKAALLSQSNPIPNQTPIEQGMGEVDLARTLDSPVVFENPLIHFGWLNERIEQRTHSLNVKNRSDQPLTIQFQRPMIESGLSWHLPLTKVIAPQETKKLNISATIRPDRLKEGVHQDYLTIKIDNDSYQLPYIFINQTATFPQIAGFEIQQDPTERLIFQVRLQLAEQADQVVIDLYDPENLTYIGQILREEDIKSGLYERELDLSHIEQIDYYLLNVTVHRQNETDYHQQIIFP